LGFGVQKLDGQTPSHLLWVALTAMALWILSFAFGCRAIFLEGSMAEANVSFLNRIREGEEAEARRDAFMAQSKRIEAKADELIAESKMAQAKTAALLAQSKFASIRKNISLQFGALAFRIILFAVWKVHLIFYPPYASPCIP
jgi:hypothetical protein